jgi:cytoskeletal protein CcmA (bactofilin family)
MASLGKSLTVQGDVIGNEDTVIEGRIEGRVDLKSHHLTVGPSGTVAGEITARRVTIVGRVTGNVSALERVEITETGRVEGDVVSPRLLVQDGGQLQGSVSMRAPQAQLAAAPAKKLEKADAAPARSPAAPPPAPTPHL